MKNEQGTMASNAKLGTTRSVTNGGAMSLSAAGAAALGSQPAKQQFYMIRV